MKKRTTVYEDRAAKEEARKKKRQEQIEKHLVVCPHCGEKVLDHMTKCHKCGGKLVPRGYTPMDEKKIKIIRGVFWGVTLAVIAVTVLLVMLYK